MEVFDAVNTLTDEWENIDFLINNAGNAHGLDLSQDADLDDWEQMIDINVKGVMYVTKALIPKMLKKKTGHIINIGSIAGKEVYLKGNAYCSSKHALTALSDGLRLDLNGTGIKVSTVSPGAVNTEFSEVRFKGDKNKANSVYEGFEPLVAKDIAELIHFIISRPSHVNLSDTIILPTAQASASIIHKKIVMESNKNSILLTCLIVLIGILQNSCEKEEQKVSYSEIELEVLQLVNQYRLSNGLDQLIMNEVHYKQAKSHSEYMIGINQTNHDNSSDRFKVIGDELGSSMFGEKCSSRLPNC